MCVCLYLPVCLSILVCVFDIMLLCLILCSGVHIWLILRLAVSLVEFQVVRLIVWLVV